MRADRAIAVLLIALGVGLFLTIVLTRLTENPL